MRVYLSKNSYLPFCEMLRANGIEYTDLSPALGQIGFTVEIIAETAPIATPLATVLVAWLNSGNSRKVELDHRRFLTRGMSTDDIVELLAQAQRLLITDEEEDEPPR